MPNKVVVKRSEAYEKLRALGSETKTVVVGVLGADASQQHGEVHGKPVTVAQVAQWNHYGTSTIPARPAITIALLRNEAVLKRLRARLAKGLLMEKLTMDQALALLGEAAVGMVKQEIADGVPPPNAPSTIARKGSSKPLIDTGQLRNSITYAVRDSTKTGG